ncbi:MAG: sulfatase-like hydrolase/transferase [Gemmatimonadetes bacterium]|nr:sulfatase-like hydrolase/transferase [Gemmatimonadota bacterium]
MDSTTEQTIDERPPWHSFLASPALVALLGALIAGGAGVLQLRMLRFGALAPSQTPVFWAWFLGLGIGLALAGAILGALAGRRKVVSFVLAAVFPIALFWLLLPGNVRERPHVLLLVTDTTRSDHLSVYGYEKKTTPFLDSYADRSVVFTNSVSQGTHTIVSTPSIVASCYPSEHGITGYADVLSNRFTLISEYLHEYGYNTYGYATNPHLSPRNGYGQGFDKYEHDPGWAYTPAEKVNDRFFAWLSEQDEDPFFGFLFYIDPHNPYTPPPAFQTLFDPEWKGDPISDWKHEWGEPEPAKLKNMVAQYDGAICYWDSELRKMFERLEALGVMENTMFLYTSDHGEEFYEHGYWGHNKLPYESSVGVPFIVSFPPPIDFPPLPRVHGTVEEVVSNVDVVPTLLEYLRIEPDETARGRSAVPLVFGGEQGPERIAYGEEILKRYGPYDIRSVRTKTHKYIKVFQYENIANPPDLFFDLVEDPMEQRNLTTERAEEAGLHEQILDLRIAEVSGLGSVEVDTVAMDEAQLERLKALGYLGD